MRRLNMKLSNSSTGVHFTCLVSALVATVYRMTWVIRALVTLHFNDDMSESVIMTKQVESLLHVTGPLATLEYIIAKKSSNRDVA
jgi:DNA-binding MltR family transcriptional regulator